MLQTALVEGLENRENAFFGIIYKNVRREGSGDISCEG